MKPQQRREKSYVMEGKIKGDYDEMKDERVEGRGRWMKRGRGDGMKRDEGKRVEVKGGWG